MRFLTKESFRGQPTPEVMSLIPAEQTRVRELAQQGVLEAVYAAANGSAMWLIWNCESQDALAEVHKTLPLHDDLVSDITLLADKA